MSPSALPLWHETNGLRIWRCADSHFHSDELLKAPSVHTDAFFAGIAAAGFNAIWLRGKLRQLMDSTVFPELNDPRAPLRRANLKQIIDRGQKHGVQVFLYFNEPLAILADDPFWKSHADLAGQPHQDYGEDRNCLSLCTSQPLVRQFMKQAINSVFDAAAGLGGVILITASEYHTHCRSHHAIYRLDDGVDQPALSQIQCPRCRGREPSAIIGELAAIWRDAAENRSPCMRVLCWNWSWSMWYPNPQAEMYQHLPEGVEVLLDFERGMQVQRRGKAIDIDEYSLSVVGPADRFIGGNEAATRQRLPVHAKLQLGTTHEIATVPNLPLIENLHGKLVGLTRQRAVGFMGTWNFGCSLTLNTAAVAQYLRNPQRYSDRNLFLHDLAAEYFGDIDIPSILKAWRHFRLAFDSYPFSTMFLYWSIINYGPAYPLSLRYEARPMGPSCFEHAWGDRLEGSVPMGSSILDIADSLDAVAAEWKRGLNCYSTALSRESVDASVQQNRLEESSCARMIGVQLRSAANIYRFHDWRLKRMKSLGLSAPCEVPMDETAHTILRNECELAANAADLCDNDPRLGFHQESQLYFYNSTSIRKKIELMQGLLSRQQALNPFE